MFKKVFSKKSIIVFVIITAVVYYGYNRFYNSNEVSPVVGQWSKSSNYGVKQFDKQLTKLYKNSTSVQREKFNNELYGKDVTWHIKIYDVEQKDDKYYVDSVEHYRRNLDISGIKVWFITEDKKIESFRKNTTITVKGKIKDVNIYEGDSFSDTSYYLEVEDIIETK